jgi:hypothetical protein
MLRELLSTIGELLSAIKDVDPKKLFRLGLSLIVIGFIGIVALMLLITPLSLILHIDPTVFITSWVKGAKAGLVDFEPKIERLYDDRIALLDKAQKELLFVGVTLYRSPQETRRSIIEALNRGVKVRLLVADPYGSWYKANASMFGSSEEELREETLATIRGYARILAEMPSTPSYNQAPLELRLVNRVFPNAFYFYDPDSSNGHLIMVARSFDINSPEMPGFHFAKIAGGVLDTYFQSCKELWDKATPYENWKKQHPEN